MIKKTLLFIVEGENDRKEIFAMLKTPYLHTIIDKYVIEFDVVKNDITAMSGIDCNNIVHAVGKRITSWIRNSTGTKHSDIEMVIHIIDTDAAFIPDSCIINDGICDFRYYDDSIKTLNVRKAMQRNKAKSEKLNRLIHTNEICNIPYQVFFVSCNMDHVLFNNRNMPDDKKGASADWFVRQCKNNPDIVLGTIFNKNICLNATYIESWKWIQQDIRSLQRHTNFNLFLQEMSSNSFQ